MAGASRSRSKDNGPAWSDVLREIYFSQPEIPTALTKSKKRKGDQAERDSNQKRNRQATKKPPMTAPPNRNDQHAPLTHTSPPLGLGHGLNRVSNMNTADAVQPQTHISHPFKLEDRLNRAGNIKKEETVQPQTGTESPPGLGSRRHHTLNLSTVEAVQPQTGTESPPRLDHRRYYIVNMTITEAVQPSTQTESPPGLGSRRHRTGNMSAVEPARAVSRRSLEDDRDLNEAGREDTHTFTSLLLPKDARISSFSPKSNADTEHQSVAKRPLFSYGQVRQAENVSEIVRSLKSTKTQQTETETPTMSSQAKRPIAAPVPSIRAGVAELSHTRDMPSQLMTPSPSKPVEKEAVPMKIPEFLKGWL
jgi:hypothetical protein